MVQTNQNPTLEGENKMQDSVESKKARLHQLVDHLPAERLETAEHLLERLRSETQTVQLGGLWEDLGIEITEEDIAEARREMWRGIEEEA
jgi:hypothetical protein